MKRTVVFLYLLSSVFIAKGQDVLPGKVVDTQEDPIANVSVNVLNQISGTSSDAEGGFQLPVERLPVNVIFSKLGYKADTVLVYTLETLTVRLENKSMALDEVVLVSDGFQNIPKERATGAFEQLDGDLVKRRISSNVLELLDGVATGLQFDNRGQSPSLNIRGINTFSSALTDPLIVVDNFPFEGSLDMINPNDVGSVTILKDAAATSIWGARAGNGVIVINLKRPQAEELKVNVTSNWSFQEPEDLFYQPIINSSDFIDLEQDFFERGHYDNLFSNPSTLRRTVLSPVVDLLHKVRIGEITQHEADQVIGIYRNHDYREDLKKFYQTGVSQQQYINVSGGSATNQHRLSFGWNKRIPNEITNKSNRITLRQNNKFNFSNGLVLSTDFSYASSVRDNSVGTSSYDAYPYTRLFDEHGNSLTVPYMLNQNYLDTVGNGQLMDWTLDPYVDKNLARNKANVGHINANITLSYPVLSQLTASVVYGYERQETNGTSFYDETSFFTRNLINRYTAVDENGELIHNIPVGGIKNYSFGKMTSHRLRGQLNFSESWTDRHEVNVLAGGEVSDRTGESNASRSYGFDPDVLTEQKVDYVNPFRAYDNLYGRSYIPYYGQSSGQTRRFISMYANGTYSFLGKYMLSASMRKDGSNLFGVRTNDRWNPLWSTGLAWAASKESFLDNVSWINNLRLRTTFGMSGNAGGGSSTHPRMSYSGNDQFSNYPYAIITAAPNPTLKWEEVQMLNSAIDFTLFNNRLSGSVEWFEKWSVDLIASDLIDPTTGFLKANRNIGKIRGEGLDIKIEGISSDQTMLPWKISLGYSYAKSTVEKFTGTIGSATSYAQHGPRLLNPIEGQELYPVMSFQFAGLDPLNGDPQGYLDGEVSKDYQSIMRDSIKTLVYHGTALPPHYGFLRGMMGWKNLQLTFSVNYKFGHYFQKNTIHYAGITNGTAHGDYYKRWQQPGDEKVTSIPSMIYPGDAQRDNFYKLSESNILKGDVIKLQDIRLNYRFDKIPIALHASVNNVGILWRANTEGLDPDYFNVPPGRAYSLGMIINL